MESYRERSRTAHMGYRVAHIGIRLITLSSGDLNRLRILSEQLVHSTRAKLVPGGIIDAADSDP